MKFEDCFDRALHDYDLFDADGEPIVGVNGTHRFPNGVGSPLGVIETAALRAHRGEATIVLMRSRLHGQDVWTRLRIEPVAHGAVAEKEGAR